MQNFKVYFCVWFVLTLVILTFSSPLARACDCSQQDSQTAYQIKQLRKEQTHRDFIANERYNEAHHIKTY